MEKRNIDKKMKLSEEDVRILIKLKIEKKIVQLSYGFWRCGNGKEHSKIAIKYLIEEHLKLPLEEVPLKVSAKTFHDTGLFRVLVEFFNSSYFKALDYTYPNQFKPWHFSKGMTGIWDGDEGLKRSIEAIKHLIKIACITEEEIPLKVTYQLFKNYGLGGMLQIMYNSSPYLAINTAFPNKFKPWEFGVKNYWKNESLESAQKATKWLVEEKLLLTEQDIRKVRRKHFQQNNLKQMLRLFYKNSHILALEDVYKF